MSTNTEDVLRQVEHRPWPLPDGPWLMQQTWRDLLFAHWSVPFGYLRPLVPEPLQLDSYDGRCWVAVTPFWMDVRVRGLPPFPGMTRMPELNVRTYVSYNGRAGVYFFSLDTTSLAAVAGARMIYALPYFYARMCADKVEDTVFYHCHRIDVDRGRPEFHGNAAPDAKLLRANGVFRAKYRPTSAVFRSQPGSLEHFLTERYCLYSVVRGRVFRGNIHHVPWPLQNAEAEMEQNTIACADGLQLPEETPLLHYARELQVLIWRPERVHIPV